MPSHPTAKFDRRAHFRVHRSGEDDQSSAAGTSTSAHLHPTYRISAGLGGSASREAAPRSAHLQKLGYPGAGRPFAQLLIVSSSPPAIDLHATPSSISAYLSDHGAIARANRNLLLLSPPRPQHPLADLYLNVSEISRQRGWSNNMYVVCFRPMLGQTYDSPSQFSNTDRPKRRLKVIVCPGAHSFTARRCTSVWGGRNILTLA
ncbi:hypothetical protein V8D89_004001 [Ganoderma adspersum]